MESDIQEMAHKLSILGISAKEQMSKVRNVVNMAESPRWLSGYLKCVLGC